jgi:predicted phosphoribosyltransferase
MTSHYYGDLRPDAWGNSSRLRVGNASTLEELNRLADEIVSLQSLEPFNAIGLYYEDFRQVSDSEVIDVPSKPASP